MSSSFLREERILIRGSGSILPAMSKKREQVLADYTRQVMTEKGLSNTDVANQSIKGERKISESTIRKILLGNPQTWTLETLEDLARGLGVPDENILDAARGRMPDEKQMLERDVAAIFKRSKELEREEDQHWFKGVIEMVDRELDRRLAQRKGKR